tara:strand:+ start:17535 stop:17657 length:123 start_codon:yes stop_codon:yes gene_type:complete
MAWLNEEDKDEGGFSASNSHLSSVHDQFGWILNPVITKFF